MRVYEIKADTEGLKAGDIILVEEYIPVKDLIGKLVLIEEEETGRTEIIRVEGIEDLIGRHLIGVITHKLFKPEPLL